MDELSMIIVLMTVSFFMFVMICVFAYNKRKTPQIRPIISASGLYTIALAIFYIDIRDILEEHYTFYIPFITFFLIMSALYLFSRAIGNLNKMSSRYPIVFHLFYSIFLSFLLGYASYKGEIEYRSIIFFIGLSIPLCSILKYYYYSKVSGMFNLITVHIYLIFTFLFIAFLRFSFYQGTIIISNPPPFIVIYLMIVNILLVSMIFSYIVEVSKQDIVELEEKRILLETMFNRVKKLSEEDELTTLYNRRKINEVIPILLQNYNETKQPFSMMMLDIDKFKAINDTYGHTVGDSVLQYLTGMLSSIIRESDFIGRWGGDEFMIILNNTNYDQCLKVADKIRHLDKLYEKDNISIPIECSIGCVQSDFNLTIDSMIQKADLALYKEKNKKNVLNE